MRVMGNQVSYCTENCASRVSAETRTNNPDRDYFHLELGVGVPLGEQVMLEAAATTLLGHSFREEDSIAIGLRVLF
jgi:hypothetical protein